MDLDHIVLVSTSAALGAIVLGIMGSAGSGRAGAAIGAALGCILGALGGYLLATWAAGKD